MDTKYDAMFHAAPTLGAFVDAYIALLTPAPTPSPPAPVPPSDVQIIAFNNDTTFATALPEGPAGSLYSSTAIPSDKWYCVSQYMNPSPWSRVVSWDCGNGDPVTGRGTGLLVPPEARLTHQCGWEDIGWPTGTCVLQLYQKALGMFLNTSRFPLPPGGLAFYQCDYIWTPTRMAYPWLVGSALEFSVDAQVPWMYPNPCAGPSVQIGIGGSLWDSKTNTPLYFGWEVFAVPPIGMEGVGFDGSVDYLSLRFTPGTLMSQNVNPVATTTSSPWSGWRTFSVRMNRAQLTLAISRVNTARAARGVAPMSMNPADYALSSIVISNEAANNGVGDHTVVGCSMRNFQVWSRAT